MSSMLSCTDLFGTAWIGWLCRAGHYSFGLSPCCPFAVVMCVDDSELYSQVEQHEGTRFFSLERQTRRRYEGRDAAADEIVPRYRAELDQALRQASGRRKIFAAAIPSPSLAGFAMQNGCELISNAPELNLWLNDKVNLHAALKELGVSGIPGKWARFSESRYGELAGEMGSKLVAQLPRGAGGSGTAFIGSEAEYRAAADLLGDSLVFIAQDLGALSVNINALALESGVVVSCPSVQLEGLAAAGARRGLYCGNDFLAVADLPTRLIDEVVEQTDRIGRWLSSLGYRGLFGLDYVLDPDASRAYAVDLNPRWQGSTTPLSLAEQKAGRLPLAVADLACRAGVLGESEILRHADEFRRPVAAAHLCLRCPDTHWSRVDGKIRPGVYDFSRENPYLRPGMRFQDLQAPKEILVTGGVPRPGTLLGPRAHSIRFSTEERIYDTSRLSLLPWYRDAAMRLQSALKLQPVEAD
jgi:hypothetical protein